MLKHSDKPGYLALTVANGLAVASLLIQLSALAGWWGALETAQERVAIGVAEMILILLLLLNSLWAAILINRSGAPGWLRSLSVCTALALLFCAGGDAINRNFQAESYAFGDVTQHSYLIKSILFFAPGYLIFILALGRACRRHLRTSQILFSGGLAVVAGLLSFLPLPPEGTDPLVQAAAGFYAALITVMAATAYWLYRAFGQVALPAAAGALMATLADALIGHFWLFDASGFPVIAHVNWIVYFTSQVLLMQLPLRLWMHHE